MTAPDEELPTIIQALTNVMRDVTAIGKKDFNTFHKFNFRGIDLVLEHVGPAFRKHGIVPVPELREILSDGLTAKDGKHKRGVTLTVAYTFYGPRGDSITAVVPGEANDTEDKGSSKAMSVAYRTALLQVLAIPTGERDPHAGPAASTKLVRLQADVKKAMADKGWSWQQLQDDYSEWSQGADIAVADENDLTAYLKVLNPQGTKTMQRRQQPAGRAAGTN
jgi:hypothetical protein